MTANKETNMPRPKIDRNLEKLQMYLTNNDELALYEFLPELDMRVVRWRKDRNWLYIFSTGYGKEIDQNGTVLLYFKWSWDNKAKRFSTKIVAKEVCFNSII